jgi:folate-binding protein YgfZ
VATDLRWCKITQSGVLRFDGPDAQSFLQGQLTNNVAALDDPGEQRSQYTGYCTPKGRLLASMLLWRREGAYYMMVPRELCEPLRKRLSMYILRAKVKAADVSAEQVLFGIAGGDAAAIIATFAGAAPVATHDATHTSNISVLQLPVNRYLIVAPVSESAQVEAALGAAASATAETLWSALDIEAGIPVVVAATQEQFVPQTVNFDLINAVSFDKGCYPGQEIVARTHYLGKGKSKQRMVRARIAANATNETPAPGDKLYSPPFGDQACGMIVAAIHANDKNYDVLAVVQTSTMTSDNVQWKTTDGPTLQIEPLPYAVM